MGVVVVEVVVDSSGRPQSPSPPSQNKNALCNQQDEQENQAGRVLSMNVHVPQWNNSGFIIIM